MNVLCVIGSRGGSIGVKGKNIRNLLGKPMIAWSIEQAKKCSLINGVFGTSTFGIVISGTLIVGINNR